MRTCKQLTHEQRCQIEALKKTNFTQQEMADTVGVSQSAISRELSRNAGQRGYRHKQAGRGCIKNRVSIDERPDVVDENSRAGDWEIDLVIGKGHSGVLVTIVEMVDEFHGFPNASMENLRKAGGCRCLFTKKCA